MANPPPLPGKKAPRKHLGAKLILGLTVLLSAAAIGWIAFRPMQILHVPTRTMSPAIEANDQVLLERFTYWRRAPRRGEIVAFRSNNLGGLPDAIYAKRVAGLPGETLRIEDGVLYVNGQPVSLRNKAGEIKYIPPLGYVKYLQSATDTVTVPADSYFVLGDNSAHSLDSRYCGFVPASAVIGRIAWCCAPAARMGRIQ